VDVELKVLWNSTAQFQDLMLKRSDGISSLAVSLPSAVDLIKGCIDAMTTNRVFCGGSWR
jgi:hypothetical protein